MLKVHLQDGSTLTFDLTNPRQAQEWTKAFSSHSFQRSISGMTVLKDGEQYSLSRPAGFTKLFLSAEMLSEEAERRFKGGERIVCQADGVRLSAMIHHGQRAVRLTLVKTGELAYNPLMDGERCPRSQER